jgi:Histidine kinase-, DNA gyrase B-, and HSP90-like ATPase
VSESGFLIPDSETATVLETLQWGVVQAGPRTHREILDNTGHPGYGGMTDSVVADHTSELAASRAPSGLGIGLALVRSLVESHGGIVTAQSAGLGQGSEFTVSLPMGSCGAASSQDVAAGDRFLS